ncbi:hypothetical protein HN873_059168 [Arachis hypogaea]
MTCCYVIYCNVIFLLIWSATADGCYLEEVIKSFLMDTKKITLVKLSHNLPTTTTKVINKIQKNKVS